MSVATENRCKELHPRKGIQCVMGQDHASCHRLGGIEQRDVTDEWVTKCVDRECEYHPHYTGIRAGFKTCIHCGEAIEIPTTSTEQAWEFAGIREAAWKAMADELRRERNYHATHHREWKERHGADTKDLLTQVTGRDGLIDMMAENLGMSVHERFLFDRHTKSIAQGQETLVHERKECRKAWHVVQQALLDWMARGCPVNKTTTMEDVFGPKLWKESGVLNRIFSFRQNQGKPVQ